MLTNEALYKRIGVRQLQHFSSPLTIDESEFVFPKNSTVHFFKPADTVIPISKDIGYLTNNDTFVVFSPIDYKDPIGKFTAKKNSANSVVKLLKKQEPRFEYVLPTTRKTNIQSLDIPLYAYNVINVVHNYRAEPLTTYYKWYNPFNTMVANIKDQIERTGRTQYVVLELPSSVPTIAMFDNYVDKQNQAMLSHFPTTKQLNILEFWRALTPEIAGDSILFKISPAQMQYVTFLFTINGKVALLNLAVLMEAVKQYSPKGKIKEMDAKTIRKLFMLFIVKTLKAPSQTMSEAMHADRVSGIQSANLGGQTEVPNADMVDEADPDENVIDDELESLMSTDTSELVINEMADDELLNTNINDIIDAEVPDSDKGRYPEHGDVVDTNKKRIDKLAEDGIVTKKLRSDIETILDTQAKTPSPYNNGKTIVEMLIVDEDEKQLDKQFMSIPDVPTNPNKVSENDPITSYYKTYVNKVYDKHTMMSIYAMQNNGMVIKSHTVDKEESVLGGVVTHTFEVVPLSGKPSKHVIKVPAIEEDGSFKISGNRYIMRKQRTDIPIRKIRATRVALTSYYGKLFIDKAALKKDDIGFWFSKKLVARAAEDDNIKNVVNMPYKIVDADAPRLYATIARFTTMFIVGGEHYRFTYFERKVLLKEGDSLSKVESNGKYVLVAKKRNGYVVMAKDGSLFNYIDGKYTDHDDIFMTTGVGYETPVEFATIKVFRKRIPLGVALAFYYGLPKLLSLTGVKHEIIERRKRREIKPHEYVVNFEDQKIIFDKRDYENMLIFGGFTSITKQLRTIQMGLLSKRETFLSVLDALGLESVYINELKLMDTMYIDPMTKDVLVEMKEPTTFRKLLFRSAELLADDNYKNPTDASGMLIKELERIPGMIYSTIVNAMRSYESRNAFGKAKMSIDPFEVWKNINNDSTCSLVDDINPIVNLKQREEVTYLGKGGRSKDTMSKDTRVFSPSEAGVISEATKDSADVGVTTTLSANPRLVNVLGMVRPAEENDKLDASNVLSTSTMLAPANFGDDPKRSGFVSIQNSHTIPFSDMKTSCVRTGYESVVPYRVADKFCYNAETDGVVLSVTKDNITVQYKDDSKKKIKLGQWTSKEEAGISYIHTVKTMLEKGDEFEMGWNISYDDGFFEPDLFDQHRVVFRQGTTLKTVLMEVPDTYEDSHAISSKIDNKLKTKVVKVKSYIVGSDDNIVNMVSVGDKVEASTPLFTIVAGGDIVSFDKELDKESLAVLQNIRSQTPKSGVTGKINKIVIFYNGGKDKDVVFSKNMLKHIAASDEALAISENKKGLTGKVDNTYSVKGKPLLPGEVEIKVYIETTIPMGVADKGVFANQLKSTVGDIITHDFKTEEGEDIDAKFSTISIDARIVTSPAKIGTTNTLLKAVGDEALKLYFGE